MKVVSLQSDNDQSTPVAEIQLQPASVDIWDKKYRLKSKDGQPVDDSVDGTYRRVARALAEVEETSELKEHWYERFLWALRHGVIPAGRITSNAGAWEHKPATSTINCTVSGTIEDSMDDILQKVHEAGLTLKAGCGIGYEFSTLRPRGAYVSGAGAYTSGPLSFMDIYDKMCFTVSSAGGRRGAQMGTFDVRHPDVLEFIRAKRENGRLRQFNLSLLITEEFMEAVKADADWDLAFPYQAQEVEQDQIDLSDRSQVMWLDWPTQKGMVVNEQGQVACKIYRTIKARRLWDMIMASTYDYAEPGFVLVDKVNRENNNWFTEVIRATNPCVTADTRLHTQFGMVPIGELYQAGIPLEVTVDRRALGEDARGTETRPAVPAFMTAQEADVYRVVTKAGFEIKATEWHDFYTTRGKIKLRDLRPGDELLVQSGRGQFGQQGSAALGQLMGLMAGTGHFADHGQDAQVAVLQLWGEDRVLAQGLARCINTLIDGHVRKPLTQYINPVAVPEQNMLMLSSALLAQYLATHGFTAKTRHQIPEVIWQGSEDCVKGYLRGLFQADGAVKISPDGQHCTVCLQAEQRALLQDVQMLLANLGILGSIDVADADGFHLLIDDVSRDRFMSEVSFLHDGQAQHYLKWRESHGQAREQSFTTVIESIEFHGREAVFDTTQADKNTVIFNGIVTGQCGEQPLPPFGSCLLGSVNLTKFVLDPFTKKARFDWDTYREVVAVFTRMLDNVVEINGLPLAQQRHEIMSKRRHGMGYLGLGSTITMLGMKYGEADSLKFTEEVSREMALAGWEVALEMAKEKGPAPILEEDFTVTEKMLQERPEMVQDGYNLGDKVKGKVLHARYSRYMQRVAEVAPDLVNKLAEVGARFTHHTSIAPTGTISLSLANNASNGIEPSFAHHYSRNVIREGRKTKEKVDVFSFELLAYRELVNPRAMPYSDDPEEQLPDYFITAETVTPTQHVDIQAAAQKWIDSSISKTANVPTDYPYEEFKDIYLYAYEKGLKGCTTFRFNPEVFQGVLVKEQDLEKTIYRFTLEDGSVMELKGNEEVEYDGEMHTAANLFDALKEGYYGRF